LRRRPSLRAAVAVVFLVVAAATPATAEALTYRWKLQGLAGRIAGLVLPDHGRGELRVDRGAGGRHKTELEITSPESDRGEYFLYGSESHPDGTAVVAWSS